MSRRNGRRGDRRNHATRAVGGIAARFAALFLGAGAAKDVWFDADLFNTSAGNASAFIDHNDAAHLWSVTGTLANPVADVALTNALSCTFAGGTLRLDSGRANTDWSFLHNGTTGMTLVHVHVKTSDTLSILLGTSTNPGAGDGLDTFETGAAGAYQHRAANVLGAVAPTTTSWANGSAYSLRISNGPAASPQFVIARNGSVLASGAYGGAASSTAAAYPLRLGQTTNSYIGRWAATYAFHRVLSASELATLSAWTTAKYGVAS